MDCKIGAAGEKSGHAGQRTAVPSGGMADGRTGRIRPAERRSGPTGPPSGPGRRDVRQNRVRQGPDDRILNIGAPHGDGDLARSGPLGDGLQPVAAIGGMYSTAISGTIVRHEVQSTMRMSVSSDPDSKV